MVLCVSVGLVHAAEKGDAENAGLDLAKRVSTVAGRATLSLSLSLSLCSFFSLSLCSFLSLSLLFSLALSPLSCTLSPHSLMCAMCSFGLPRQVLTPVHARFPWLSLSDLWILAGTPSSPLSCAKHPHSLV